MSEAIGTTIPKPIEFCVDGRRFVQYGMSPVKMASLRSSWRKAKKGTRKNPIIKGGKEYVYAQDGRLLLLEHFDRNTVERNKLSVETALTKEKAEKLREFNSKPFIPDEDCPELSDDQIARILEEAKAQKKSIG